MHLELGLIGDPKLSKGVNGGQSLYGSSTGKAAKMMLERKRM